MRLLFLLLLAFATAIASAEILDVECEDGLEKVCCDGQTLPGADRQPGDIGDDAKTGCTSFGSDKEKCSNRENLACCGAIHGSIGTQCKGVEDEQIICREPALSYRKHKRWSLPLKRALFQKREDFCDQRAGKQQFQAPKPVDNTVGFPAVPGVGDTLNMIHELSKSDDKGTKSYPGSTTFDPAPVDLTPATPADAFNYYPDPYFQQNFKA